MEVSFPERQEDLELARVRESVGGSGADTLSRETGEYSTQVKVMDESIRQIHTCSQPRMQIRSHPIPAMQGLCPARGRIRVPRSSL